MAEQAPLPYAYNVVTCICVDTAQADDGTVYPLLGNLSAEERRLQYWKLAWVLMITSRLCQPEQRHMVYTNDPAPVMADGQDLKALLATHGVEVVVLPFQDFLAPKRTLARFANAFYKLEVFKALAQLDKPSILLDNDVVWAHRNAELEQALAQGQTMFYDIYERSATPDSRQFLGVSMRDFGQYFKDLDPSYPQALPVTIGGEVAAGAPAMFGDLYAYLHPTFWEMIKRIQQGPPLPGGERSRVFINGMETLLSMGVNRLEGLQWMNPYIKRFYNIGFLKNIKPGDERKPIWHLPSEKHRGLANLYAFIMEGDTRFWHASPEERAKFMGDLVAVPKRRIRRETDPTWWQDQVRTLRGRAGLARNKVKEWLGIYHS